MSKEIEFDDKFEPNDRRIELAWAIEYLGRLSRKIGFYVALVKSSDVRNT